MTTQIIIFIALKLAEIAALCGACWGLTKLGRWAHGAVNPSACRLDRADSFRFGVLAIFVGSVVLILAATLLFIIYLALAANWQWAGSLAP